MGHRSHHDACRRPAGACADMYEHAYHMDYGAKAATYVDAFMEAIRWPEVRRLYDRERRPT